MSRTCLPVEELTASAFHSALGWLVAMWRGDQLWRLSIGHPSEEAARSVLETVSIASNSLAQHQRDLVTRLQQYAEGQQGDFWDVSISWAERTLFQRAILEQCRKIPWGVVSTYGELAERAGRPGSARAVGNVMANNRIPIIIPCHRVVGAGRALGGFSAPDGVNLKRRLLLLEGIDR